MPNTSSPLLKKASGSAKDRMFSVAAVKAHFSEVVATVEKRRQSVTILRRGRAVAKLVPIDEQHTSLYGAMRGTITEVGDIVGPTGGEWSVGDE